MRRSLDQVDDENNTFPRNERLVTPSRRFDGLPKSDDVVAWAALIRAAFDLGETCVFNYEPGNGTRYTLIFTPLNMAQGDQLPGTDEKFVLVSWERRGAYPFALLEHGHYLDVFYVMEKFGCNEATAQPLCDLFHAITGFVPEAATASKSDTTGGQS